MASPHPKALDVVAYLKDTSSSEADAAEEFDIPEDEIIDIMVDEGFERCSVCGYWDEDGAMADDGMEMYAHPECL